MKYWLLKSEPNVWSIKQQKKAGSKGAPWEDLNKHNAGWWIEIGLDPLIKSLIHAMSLESNKLKRLGINGRNWMINEYAWSEIARDFTKTYDWIINNGEQPNHIIK